MGGCIAVNPSDPAPALVAFGASVRTTRRTVDAEDLRTTILGRDGIVTEIRVPRPGPGTKSAFIKYALRRSIDFPIVNCCTVLAPEGARICLDAVFNNPYRPKEAERVVSDGEVNEATAREAGDAAVSRAKPLPSNRYKVPIARTLVKRTVLACA